MADLTAARSPPLLPAAGALQVLPPATRHVLRGGPGVRIRAGNALGFEVPASACRAAVSGDCAALWLGPDEWLLIAPAAGTEATTNALGEALASLPCSLVDVSHRQVGLMVSGPQAETLLAAGCPLDLEAGAFPVNMCTRTMLAKAEIVLWRTGAQAFRVEVWRSFAPYVAAFLAEAALGII
ncbi:MAG: sarcosine oxidase subunit gamma [Steroidobacterales bacterium]|jgi:sarcosine oxidase subunit gamma